VECAREDCPRINGCTGVIAKQKGQCCPVCQESQGKDLWRKAKLMPVFCQKVRIILTLTSGKKMWILNDLK